VRVRKRWIFLIIILPVLMSLVFAGIWALSQETAPDHSVAIKAQIKDARDQAYLIKNPEGGYSYQIKGDDGVKALLTPEQFAARQFDEQNGRSWFLRACNVTSYVGLAWIVVGLIGQVMFTGRMIVQWLVTEKNQKSVVPVSFWWMSLIGSTMLLVYFVWRVDPIGILGQTFGWGVYLRNLYAIYKAEDEAEDKVEGAGAQVSGAEK
jgi:lipid-A-disaccharide synthase-like uncharacterized protein